MVQNELRFTPHTYFQALQIARELGMQVIFQYNERWGVWIILWGDVTSLFIANKYTFFFSVCMVSIMCAHVSLCFPVRWGKTVFKFKWQLHLECQLNWWRNGTSWSLNHLLFSLMYMYILEVCVSVLVCVGYVTQCHSGRLGAQTGMQC